MQTISTPWRRHDHTITRYRFSPLAFSYLALLGAVFVFGSALSLVIYLILWLIVGFVLAQSSRETLVVPSTSSPEWIDAQVARLNQAGQDTQPALVMEILSGQRQGVESVQQSESQVQAASSDPHEHDAPTVSAVRGDIDQTVLALRRQNFAGPTLKALVKTRDLVSYLTPTERLHLHEDCEAIHQASARIAQCQRDGIGDVGKFMDDMQHIVNARGPRIRELRDNIARRRQDESSIDRIYNENTHSRAPELDV